MNQIDRYQYFALLILKERLGVLNDAEKAELGVFLTENMQVRLIYKQLKEKDFAEDIGRYAGIDSGAGLSKYRRLCREKKKRMIYRWRTVAAVLVTLLITGLYLFRYEKQELPLAVICPGASRAELILGDGSVRHLESVQQTEEIKVGERVIRNTGTQVCYVCDSMPVKTTEAFELVYNELRVPTGGEYQLVLSDGTKVWLNSQTNLRFPVEFGDKERMVYLEGEAYFEVSRDEQRPFSVCTKDQVNIQVLGTSFNVRAYGDENTVETVLREGSVKMDNHSTGVILTPGQRGICRSGEQGMRIENVDTDLYIAWKDGQFVFDNYRVEDIMRQLARWYGVKVFYQNEKAKDVLFSGDVKRYELINTLLKAMEISGGVRFEIKGNTVIVSYR